MDLWDLVVLSYTSLMLMNLIIMAYKSLTWMICSI
ncbi:hypothetical protein Leryth_024209 [Lithospermum erythrorhizon]|nr:hypothetical protein Leryth_024209 [Lithospermum erythrorhizon]